MPLMLTCLTLFGTGSKLGLLPASWTPAPMDPSIPRKAIDKNRNWQAERMAVYAAQIAKVDHGLGRLLKVLKDSGADKNTLVLFLSDNGAAKNGELIPSKSGFGFKGKGDWRKDGVPIKAGSGPDLMPGPDNTFAGYGPAWASLSGTPFRSYKQSAYEGGIRAPFIARWPEVITEGGTLTKQVGHVMDFMPTFLELADVEYPKEFHGRHPLPLEGRSLVPIFRGESKTSDPHPPLAWHTGKGRSIIIGDWKLVKDINEGKPDRAWELYDLNDDGGETQNLATKNPKRVSKMATAYETWKKRVGAK